MGFAGHAASPVAGRRAGQDRRRSRTRRAPASAGAQSLIERRPALRIGSAARIDAIAADDWRGFAAQAGYAPRYVLDRVAAKTTVVLDALNATASQVVAKGANAARIERTLRTIGANGERMREGVGARGITGKASRV